MDLLRDNGTDATTLAATFHALLDELFVHSIISSTVYSCTLYNVYY
jgi:hypothetical protein